jgi:hypothetical protein
MKRYGVRGPRPPKQPPHHSAGVASGPNSVPNTTHPAPPTPRSTPPTTQPREAVLATTGQTRPVTQPVVPQFLEPPHPHGQPPWTGKALPHQPTGQQETVLLRKEVIQPHLPVRLPCYDFVPIASPTFDHSPPYGLGHGLRVLPTFVT